MSTQKVSEDDLIQAARLRYEARKPWKDCAEEIGITDRQLRRIRKTPGWSEAVADIVAEFEQDAIPLAIGYLIHEVEKEGKDAIQAAKALIDAYKAARLEVSGPGGGPIEYERKYSHISFDELTAYARAGLGEEGVASGEGSED